ncbi:MAG: hypothetical protein M1820_009587 [Bogoriella megaspora]|nr:MAG: hypothetical protein M1820_009587 [Bogoriella megaspora]
MLNAGGFVTANTTGNFHYQLLKSPENLKRWREEADDAIDEGDVIASYGKTPPGGASVLNGSVPSGTITSTSGHSAERQTPIFKQAHAFPERWLGKEDKALQPYFIALGAGARDCVGRQIGDLVQAVSLASVLH